jgi:polyisoprenoid-binding protein YceI
MLWNIDPTHTEIGFSVRHLGISNVRGRFQKFEGTVETDAAGAPTAVSVSIDAASVDTNVVDRDNHLRSADFLDVANHPAITYRSRKISRLSDREFDVSGDLTIHGVTRTVSFRIEAETPMKDPWGYRRVAATAAGKLNRKEFGLGWNQLLEAGGFVVGDEVKFNLEVEVVAAAAAAAAA